jgi:prepilin-type N-terminal cleavage/methylation domain-containing protein
MYAFAFRAPIAQGTVLFYESICMNKRPMARQAGFTLVEIAIVLVIIGLLLGGVLKGQELIKSAKIKSYKTTLNSVSAAYNTYTDLYKALPGDDKLAQTRFPVTSFPGMLNGNGNGVIAGGLGDAAMASESNLFFMHLAAGGLLGTNPNGATPADLKPKGPNGEIVGVQYGAQGIPGLTQCFVAVNGETAELLDIAFDDGLPVTGSMRVAVNNAANLAKNQSYTAFAPAYKTTSYNLCTIV